MSDKACFHCGLTSHTPIVADNQTFCCSGCVTVYEILKKGKLYKYYDIEDSPGVRVDTETREVYDYLEQEDIKKSVLDFYNGQFAKIRLYIPAIHCSSCIWLLENLEKLNPGIISSQVNFNKKQVSINFNETKIKLSEVMALLQSIHYKPHLPDKKQEQSKQTKNKLIIKLGIAGFAFGNVMLLSFPEYLSEDISLNSKLVNSFGWISLLLSLPVVFYSASDYFLATWKNLVKKVISIDLPIVLGILAILFRSIFEIATATGPGYLDSLTGLVFFLLIGKWYQSLTYQALNFENDYTNYFPLGVTRIGKNEKKVVPIGDLLPDDKILLKNAEILPADSKLLSDSALIDYSFITGESIPVTLRKSDTVYAGGKLIGSSVEFSVQKKVESSYLAQLWKERTKKDESSLQISHTLNRVSKYFTFTILIIALGTAIYWLFADSSKMIFAFASVLIVACPCALALSVPFAFGHGRRILGKHHFFLKDSTVIENLFRSKVIVFDKTGTLTNPTDFDIEYISLATRDFDISIFKSLLEESNHPLSRAVASHLETSKIFPVEAFNEITGKGIEGTINGSRLRVGSAEFISREKSPVMESTQVHLEINGNHLGYFKIRNHYRPGWKELIKDLAPDYSLHLLSGDNEAEKETILALITKPKQVNFNQTPEDKLNYIRHLKKCGQEAIMVGDGLNDAGALNESLAGISVADDVYQFTPSSDAIVNAGSLSRIPSFLKFVKTVMKIVYISFGLSFAYNAVGISYAASGNLSPIFAAILMPLSSITIVAFTSIATMAMSRRLKAK